MDAAACTPADAYAYYLWNHIGTVAWWAKDLRQIGHETISFTREDGISGLHFFTPRDLLIGAERAAHYMLTNPLASQLPSLPPAQMLNVLHGQWQDAPTDRTFVDVALQLAVFATIEFPLLAEQTPRLMSA